MFKWLWIVLIIFILQGCDREMSNHRSVSDVKTWDIEKVVIYEAVHNYGFIESKFGNWWRMNIRMLGRQKTISDSRLSTIFHSSQPARKPKPSHVTKGNVQIASILNPPEFGKKGRYADVYLKNGKRLLIIINDTTGSFTIVGKPNTYFQILEPHDLQAWEHLFGKSNSSTNSKQQ